MLLLVAVVATGLEGIEQEGQGRETIPPQVKLDQQSPDVEAALAQLKGEVARLKLNPIAHEGYQDAIRLLEGRLKEIEDGKLPKDQLSARPILSLAHAMSNLFKGETSEALASDFGDLKVLTVSFYDNQALGRNWRQSAKHPAWMNGATYDDTAKVAAYTFNNGGALTKSGRRVGSFQELLARQTITITCDATGAVGQKVYSCKTDEWLTRESKMRTHGALKQDGNSVGFEAATNYYVWVGNREASNADTTTIYVSATDNDSPQAVSYIP